MRTLLGAFGLDAMAQVTTALGGADGSAMLTLVDELERNGGSPQHFSRELSRYIRNLLVIRIAGTDSRLVTAGPAEKKAMAQIAASFSEEDLTRYLQLSLDLFRDLQYSMQPRFHLEIGLLKMIQAGKLLPIEEALASLSGDVKAPEPALVKSPTASYAAACGISSCCISYYWRSEGSRPGTTVPDDKPGPPVLILLRPMMTGERSCRAQ